ncbi:MAG TPA: LysR family transcriptional regulator [Polyangium sp.]|nr:LysR family transcriptional regulator [Polyangium sp.]
MDFLGRARTLVRIVEAGSFSSAARSLGLSLAAISRQIGTLEEELGAKLFVRTTRSLHLTDEGRRFHEHATRLVREADAAMASVRPDRAIGGRVVVSASVALGVLRIVPALPALLDVYPALEFEMRLEDREAELVGEGVDIAVRAGMALPDTTNLVALQVATFARVLVASPAYLRRHGMPRTVDSLASHAAVLGLSSFATWHFVEEGETRAVTVAPKLRVATMFGIRAAVEAGMGIAVVPQFVVEDALAAGSLRALLPEATLSPVSAHALYRIENRGSPRIDAIVAHIRATLPTDPSPAAPARGRRRA